jgi:hypothetical protein
MLMETFMRKQLGLKAHLVTRVEETEKELIIHIDRLEDVRFSVEIRERLPGPLCNL